MKHNFKQGIRYPYIRKSSNILLEGGEQLHRPRGHSWVHECIHATTATTTSSPS